MASSARIAEKLLILNERGNGLLLRLHYMKQDFLPSNVENSSGGSRNPGLELVHVKPLSAFTKTILNAKKLTVCNACNKTSEELQRVRKILEPALCPHLDTLLGKKKINWFVDHVIMS